MTSFTFSLDQLRSAPPEVRRWFESEIGAALAGLNRPPHDAEPHRGELAACTPEEAAKLFALIKDNFPLTQVFFELARDVPQGGGGPFHTLNVAEILRHTRLANGDQLADCLAMIDRAFQEIRGNGEAALFGFDQYGRVYIHETTHQSVRWVWQQLMAAHAPRPGGAPPAGDPQPFGFQPPQLGPSEPVAAHMPGPGAGRT
jgi:hypothetical protein